MRIAAAILLIPLLFTLGFFAYAGLANDPGCGSAEPSTCFGAGILAAFIIGPLALLTTPAAIVLFILDWKKRRQVKRLQGEAA